MVNAWSLAYEVLYGNMDETYPIRENIDLDREIEAIKSAGGFEWTPENGKTSKMEPSINKSTYKKYEEDKGIADLQDYVTSTYNGHYTSKGTNVQTLDLIESVGDAEAFCRSNAIKYLSRYDKKGQAKRDILKAMHYCLLLYYFSGQTHDNDIQHGYETFQ